jgi:hypothetical protein
MVPHLRRENQSFSKRFSFPKFVLRGKIRANRSRGATFFATGRENRFRMLFGVFSSFGPKRLFVHPPWASRLAPILAMMVTIHAKGESVVTPAKQIIGATAKLTEVSTGFTFPARIDTGAETCSLHVEKITIDDKVRKRTGNVGKTIRFLVMNEQGKQQWIETRIATAVRVKSGVIGHGEFDHRYKVPLTFEWNGFRKEVLVSLNDRTHMEYPLLIGRNFLSGDFLVDVDRESGE